MAEKKGIQYSEYLQLDKILQAQEPESWKHGKNAHDEMLFIITHQAFELWFKQVMFELKHVMNTLSQEYVPEYMVADALHKMRRINTILALLCDQFNIIETMSPRDFMEFRDFLYPASGFQSAQFRVLEITLGINSRQRVEIDSKGFAHRLTNTEQNTIQQIQQEESLFTIMERWLEKLPFMETGEFKFWEQYRSAVQRIFKQDREELASVLQLSDEQREQQLKQIAANESAFDALFSADSYEQLLQEGKRRLSQRASLSALFISVYSDYPLLQTPYRLLDAILEMDKHIAIWRMRHTMMVTRMIGTRVGTGGSSGYDYLLKTVSAHRVFADVSALSGYLLAKEHIPQLPNEIATKLQYVAEVQ